MLGLLKKKNPTEMDCQEVYNLWDALTSRYNAIQQVHIWYNFVHDICRATRNLLYAGSGPPQAPLYMF